MDRAEHPPRFARFVPNDIALAVHKTNFTVRPDDTVFGLVTRAATSCLSERLYHLLSIFRVNQLLNSRKIDDLLLGRDAEHAIGFVRPGDAAGSQVALPVAEVRDPL